MANVSYSAAPFCNSMLCCITPVVLTGEEITPITVHKGTDEISTVDMPNQYVGRRMVVGYSRPAG